jgi:PadR family transcriptional regulator, regulatory protein AphA
MSLPHAILGFLQTRPMTGYDLKTICFDGSVAHFWPADQSQIYRTLDTLTEKGWVESELEVQTDRPNRKIYSITAGGRAELSHWLQTQQDLPVHREPFLVQLFFSGQLPDAQIIELMESQLAAHETVLAHYHAIYIPEICPDPALQRSTDLQRMTLDMGKRMEQMVIDWLRDCISRVKEF